MIDDAEGGVRQRGASSTTTGWSHTGASRCAAAAPKSTSTTFAVTLQRRCLSSRPSRFGRKKVEVLEKEAEAPSPSSTQQGGSPFGFGQQQQQYQQQQYGAAPSSAFPAYTPDREKERQQQGSQWDALGYGVVEHMRKVYGTLAVGIGIAAGASMVTMATPLLGVHPLVPGIGAMIPLMGIMYTSKHTHSQALRAGMFAAFTGLSGVAIAPLMMIALKVNPILVPQALVLTTGLFASMTGLSLMAKPGATLRWGVPLGGGLLLLMATGLGSMFVPVTSAWYPLLHSFQLYGGLALFTAYIAYDTQKMIDEYEMGEDDHLKHAVDLFIDFKVIFTRILSILMMRDD